MTALPGTRLRRLAVLLALLLTGAALPSAASAATTALPVAGCVSPLLTKATAVTDLVARVGEDAAVLSRLEDRAESLGHGVDLVELADDPTAWVGRCGQVHFVEPKEAVQQAEAVQQLQPLDQTFALESRPGATRVIYLDFNGQTVTNSYFNEVFTGGAAIVAAPFSTDGDVSTDFSADELTHIQNVWSAVAEDYAPFDVNVTTKDPGTDGIVRSSAGDTRYGSRAIITQGGPIASSCSCGGFATMGTFDAVQGHEYAQPAWIFASGSATYDALTISHEVGHNLGLEHHGTSTSGYYSGAGSWIPIMGGGTERRVSQWSSGEYLDADNPTQDDVALIAAQVPVVADDHTVLGAGVPTPLAAGVPVTGAITTRDDHDTFAFAASGGTTLTVTGSSWLSNLDASLTIRDDAGATVAQVDPLVASDGLSGLGATWSGSLPAGDYTATVDGVGNGDPASEGGYSDYGSLGRYAIGVDATADVPAVDASTPVADSSDPQSVTVSAPSRMKKLRVVVHGSRVILEWSAARTVKGQPITRYLLDLSKGHDRTAATSGTTVLKHVRRGRYRIRIAARSSAGTSPYSGWIGFRVR